MGTAIESGIARTWWGGGSSAFSAHHKESCVLASFRPAPRGPTAPAAWVARVGPGWPGPRRAGISHLPPGIRTGPGAHCRGRAARLPHTGTRASAGTMASSPVARIPGPPRGLPRGVDWQTCDNAVVRVGKAITLPPALSALRLSRPTNIATRRVAPRAGARPSPPRAPAGPPSARICENGRKVPLGFTDRIIMHPTGRVMQARLRGCGQECWPSKGNGQP